MNLNLSEYWRWHPAVFANELSKGRWKRYRHLDYIADEIVSALAKGGGRLIVSAPPRHGKSEFISHWVPVWFLENFPDQNVILASYEAEVAAGFGRKVRNEFESHPELKTKLSPDSTAAHRFNTNRGGGMITAGAEGPITGRGGKLLIIDDPIKNKEDADSALKRKKIIEWFEWVFYTRAEPGATIILLMTRWHESDLAGYLIKNHSDNWKEIKLPAIAEDRDPLGRMLGEALCPERYEVQALQGIKAGIGPRGWSALYQQNPTVEEGNLVKREDFKYWKELPSRFEKLIQSWDMTFKETQDGSYVVGQVWGKFQADYFLVDQVRTRTEFVGAQNLVKSFTAKHPKAIPILIEDKANGPAIISSLKREVSGIVPIDVKGSKYARLEAVSPLYNAGNVHLPDPTIAPWIHDYIEEVVSFPSGSHDDQVDASSQALDYLREKSQAFTENMIPRSIGAIASAKGKRDQW